MPGLLSFAASASSFNPATVTDWAGPTLTVAQTQALGSDFTKYESLWSTYEPQHYTAAASFTQVYNDIYSGGATYGRPLQYWMWAAKVNAASPSTAAIYLSRGNTIYDSYTSNYLFNAGQANYNAPEWYNTQWIDVATHYLLTGNSADSVAIGKQGDFVAFYVNSPPLGGSFLSNRIQSNGLDALLAAWKINAPSTGGPSGTGVGQQIGSGKNFATWADALSSFKTQVLATQAANGSWPFTTNTSNSYGYQMGMISARLIHYYHQFSADSDIITAVKKTAEYLWLNQLDPSTSSFWYLTGYNSTGGEVFGTTPTWDLNGWQITPFYWLYYQTGDTTWKDRGDAILASAVQGDGTAHPGADVYLYKQFSELYQNSFRGIYYRQQTPLSSTSVINSVAPVISGTSTLSTTNGTWSGSPTFTYQWKKYLADDGVAFNASISGGVMTVNTVYSGTLKVGEDIYTTDAPYANLGSIVSFGTGSGGTGTYNITPSQTLASRDLAASKAQPITNLGTSSTQSTSGIASGWSVYCVVTPSGDGTPARSNVIIVP